MCDLVTWFVRFMLVKDFLDSLVILYWERAVLLALLVCHVNLDGRLSACISILFHIYLDVNCISSQSLSLFIFF